LAQQALPLPSKEEASVILPADVHDYLLQTHYPRERCPPQFPDMKELISLESSFFAAVQSPLIPDADKDIDSSSIATITPTTDNLHCPAIPVEPDPPSSPVPADGSVVEDAGAPALTDMDVACVAAGDSDVIAANLPQPTVPNPATEPKHSITRIRGRVHSI
jgi:hypothetical protein